MSRPHLLLLGGTREARQLAEALASWPVDLTTSLAGATRAPRDLPGRLRVGGFGGAEGLARWIVAQDVALLIDATHPFAVRISANAAAASRASGCPLLRLDRAPWQPRSGEVWQEFRDLAAAIAALPPGARGFLTTGSGSVPDLCGRTDLRLFLRSIDPVEDLPDAIVPILARPPFSLKEERAFMTRHGITHLVTRNSGGAGRAKLDAAAALGLPVLMIRRPDPPTGIVSVSDPAALLGQIAAALSLDSASGAAP